MKISNIIFTVSAVAAPFTASATMMNCKSNAVFHVKEDAENPYVPSKDVLNWMTDQFKETFTGAYSTKEDIEMTADHFSKFNMKPDGAIEEADNEASATTTSLADIVNNLRVGGKNRYKNWSWGWYGTSVRITKLNLMFQCVYTVCCK